MKLKKLKAARAKWLENQQAQQRPNEDLQLIANSARATPVLWTRDGWPYIYCDRHKALTRAKTR